MRREKWKKWKKKKKNKVAKSGAPEVNSPSVEVAVCDSPYALLELQIADLPQRLCLPRLSHTIQAFFLHTLHRCSQTTGRRRDPASRTRISTINLRHLVLLLAGLFWARRPLDSPSRCFSAPISISSRAFGVILHVSPALKCSLALDLSFSQRNLSLSIFLNVAIFLTRQISSISKAK